MMAAEFPGLLVYPKIRTAFFKAVRSLSMARHIYDAKLMVVSAIRLL